MENSFEIIIPKLSEEKYELVKTVFNVLHLHMNFHMKTINLFRDIKNSEFKNGFFRGLARLEESFAFESLSFMQKLAKKSMDFHCCYLECDLDYIKDKQLAKPENIIKYFEMSDILNSQTIDKLILVIGELEDYPKIKKVIKKILKFVICKKRILNKFYILSGQDIKPNHLNYELDHKIHEHFHEITKEMKEIKKHQYKIL